MPPTRRKKKTKSNSNRLPPDILPGGSCSHHEERKLTQEKMTAIISSPVQSSPVADPAHSTSKVIIIGKNHHHTLSVARVFGLNGIKPYGIVVGKGAKFGFVRRSRCWQKVWGVNDEVGMTEILRREFQNETLKPVVIPCSDPEAIALDNNLDELSKRYILGSFNHEQGRIPQLMDKFAQVEFVRDRLGLDMAESFIIDLTGGNIPDALPFPCLVKPVVSAEGSKGDIRKFTDKDSLREYFGTLRAKGYTRILAQRFLDIDYEFCLSGCCGDIISYFVSKTVRAWPNVGGLDAGIKSWMSRKFMNYVSICLRKFLTQGIRDS